MLLLFYGNIGGGLPSCTCRPEIATQFFTFRCDQAVMTISVKIYAGREGASACAIHASEDVCFTHV